MRALSWMLLRERRFTSNAADVLLICAVAIGDLEARPMTAFKLARMAHAGLVVRDGRGRYELTDKARRRAAGVV